MSAQQGPDDLRKWDVYDPRDPEWNLPPAGTAHDAIVQAHLIVLRYRDAARLRRGSPIWEMLSTVAEAIRNLPTADDQPKQYVKESSPP